MTRRSLQEWLDITDELYGLGAFGKEKDAGLGAAGIGSSAGLWLRPIASFVPEPVGAGAGGGL
ncbi:MAG TPA: hypothetical protein VK423_05760 [Thermoplasmata archaeon]|nr:hypothetical protein [Thermoplasmata archaeon]